MKTLFLELKYFSLLTKGSKFIDFDVNTFYKNRRKRVNLENNVFTCEKFESIIPTLSRMRIKKYNSIFIK